MVDSKVQIVNTKKSIWTPADSFYKGVKLVGIDGIEGLYNKETIRGKNISRQMRALYGYIVMNMYNMNDSDNSITRLEHHLGLEEDSMSSILYATGVLKKAEKPELISDCIHNMLQKYIGRELKAEVKEVCVQELYKLVELKRYDVNLFTLWMQADELFKSIIVFGPDNVLIEYYDNDGERVIKKGKEIPIEMRGLVEFIVINMYRMNDDNTMLLDKRFGLEETSIQGVLWNTDIFMDPKDKLGYLCLRDIVKRYLRIHGEVEFLSTQTNTICAQELYDLICTKKYKGDDIWSLWNLWITTDSLYKSAKIVGIDNTIIWYNNENNERVFLQGREIPDRMKGFTEESVIYMYRMNDSDASRKRIEDHLGMYSTSKNILGDTNLFMDSYGSLPYICMRDMTKRYLKI